MARILAKFATAEGQVRFPSTSLLRSAPIAGTLATASATTTTTISYRKNILNLTASELANLRSAFTRLYQISAADDRSYQHIAGLHGFPPPVYCTHGNPLFAVWHRPYLQMMEKSLQEMVPGVTIPYWDWTAPITRQQGLPKAYTDAKDAAGNDNSLLKARIEFAGSAFPETNRDPGTLSTFDTLAAQVRQAQRVNSTYTRYSTAIESPHNGLHGWVGGTMGRIPYSAYDPIFWAHHCNIDRLFSEWQATHPNIIPKDEAFNGKSIWKTALTPFGVTTEEIWDIKKLGYEYLTNAVQLNAATAARKFDGAEVVGFSLASIEPTFDKAELEFQNVLHSHDSCEIRVFLNQPDATAATPTVGNDRYAGSVFLFGHGDCPGDAGHCAPDRGPIDQFDIRRSSHTQPFNAAVDVTEAIQKLSGSTEVSVNLIVVDPKGNQLQNPGTDFEAILLTTT